MSDTETVPARSRKTVLLGKGDLAIRVAEWFLESPLYDLAYVVPVIPEPAWTASLADWARSRGINVIGSGDYRDLPGALEGDFRVDLAFSVFYDRIIQSWFINRCQRILNLHNGPLPRYRGVSPINWALKNGEDLHGVTIHSIEPGIDSGPIYGQILYSIYPETDEVIDVYQRALRYGYRLFEETMPLLDGITPRPQDESAATYYSANKNDLLRDRRGIRR